MGHWGLMGRYSGVWFPWGEAFGGWWERTGKSQRTGRGVLGQGQRKEGW